MRRQPAILFAALQALAIAATATASRSSTGPGASARPTDWIRLSRCGALSFSFAARSCRTATSANRKRPPPCGVSLATPALHRAELLPESIALRVARLNARTRLHSFAAIHVGRAMREASPQASIAPDTQAHPLIKTSSLSSWQPSQTDELGRFNSVSGRFETSQTSQERPRTCSRGLTPGQQLGVLAPRMSLRAASNCAKPVQTITAPAAVQ